MIPAIAVMEARRAEHGEINRLYMLDMERRGPAALLRSGPPVDLTRWQMEVLYHVDHTVRCVARDLESGTMIGHASAHHTVHGARGSVATVEEVVTHPDFDGRGVARAVMTSLMRYVFEEWRCVRIDLVSEPHRVAARAMYASLGFVQQPETDRFVCRHPVTTAYATRICGATTSQDHARVIYDVYVLKPAVSR